MNRVSEAGAVTHLELELERGDGPIAGRVRDGESEVVFRGWLTLAAALESIRSAMPPAGTRRDGPSVNDEPD